MVYAFVRAITSVSAVIFLVSGEYSLATVYIVRRAEFGEYGLAICLLRRADRDHVVARSLGIQRRRSAQRRIGAADAAWRA